MRVLIADDEMLLREGLSRLLTERGVDVVGTASDAAGLLAGAATLAPDVVIVDIKMPPTFTDEGLVAAQEVHRLHPDMGVLVLSHYLEPAYALRLLNENPERTGYLLKERVADVAVLSDALNRLRDGECVLDPSIVARLLRRPRSQDKLASLTEREGEVLALMAEGHSNLSVAERLVLSARTVESHIGQIFQKLDLDASLGSHRRVLAVLTFLRS